MTTDILTSLHGSRIGLSKDNQIVVQNPTTGALYAVTPVPEAGNEVSSALLAATVGAVNTVTGLSCSIAKNGNIATLDFTFSNVAVTHTDAGGSGSSGSLKLFDFVQQAVLCIGSKVNLTLATDTTMDVAGDLSAVIGFGSAAANAGDGALTGTEVDYVAVSSAITFASNAATVASQLRGAGTAVDGTSTAADIYFNESGTAATSDANGTMTVNGTARLVFLLLGDD